MSPTKQEVVYLTADEIDGLARLAQMLIDGEGRAKLLEKIPISEAYVVLLKSATGKLEKKLKEIDERSNG